MDLNETTLKAWYLVTFFDAPEPNRILWGTVEDDPSFRWYPGDWCCTSPVLQVSDEGIYITQTPATASRVRASTSNCR